MAVPLYIGNLSKATTADSLQKAFLKYGSKHARVVDGKGFGFVEVDNDRAAEATREMNGFELDGRRLFVGSARTDEYRTTSD